MFDSLLEAKTRSNGLLGVSFGAKKIQDIWETSITLRATSDWEIVRRGWEPEDACNRKYAINRKRYTVKKKYESSR